MVALHAITIFLGSFLLFQLQPMLAKQLIPLFGGSEAVWTTCMIFFQSVLIGGYAYSHGLTYLAKKKQAFVHILLMGVSLLFLNLDFSGVHSVIGADSAVSTILLLLAFSVAIPFLLLSASSPLIQYWAIKYHRERSPWKLYALSNTASLLALVSYPLIVEPILDIDSQIHIWRWGYIFYLLLCAICLLKPLRQMDTSSSTIWLNAAKQSKNGFGKNFKIANIVLWFFCSASGTATMLAVTNQIGQQVPMVPFLCVLTLAVYLLTFIICFSVKHVLSQRWEAIFLLVAFVLAILSLTAGNGFTLTLQLPIFTGVLFCCCMICHGQLVRLRPLSSALTSYYLVIATGGAGGALFISLLLPHYFNSYMDLPIIVIAICLLFTVGGWRARSLSEPPRWFFWFGLVILCCQVVFSWFYFYVLNKGVVESSRNFYGSLKVVKESDAQGEKLTLKHGVTSHGSQYQSDALENIATTYYGPYSGAGLAIRLHPRRLVANGGSEQRRLKVGLIGLGVGTLALYGEAGDEFRFYEIDPSEIHLAQEHFSYLRNSNARVEIITGDARLSLQREAVKGDKQQFDVLVIDAFSSDTIPVHLITREALGLYRYHLKADGIMAFHISSRILDLMPVVATHATAYSMTALNVIGPAEPELGREESNWAILTSNQQFLDNEQVRSRARSYSPKVINWTDRFSSIWQALY